MQNLLEDLTKLLSKEEKYTSEGRMLKNVIVEDALKLEPVLIKLLLSDKNIKKHFFQDIKGTYVFDKIKFQKFISNKKFLPDSYTAFKNKIGLTTDDEYITKKKDVVLSWPYKDCVLEGGQDKEDAKRDEIFWNETLAPDEIDRLLSPKVLTNWKKYDKDGEHTVEEVTEKDNLIIKGNNLLGLSSILKKYRGKVKLIYIDPPYNTGSDSFKYNDNFTHSTWLTFMKNRLEVSRELLRNDGSVCISIDDDESHYLKILCDDVFGRNNFIANVIWKKKYSPQNDAKYFSDMHDHILVFSKNKERFEINLIPRTDDMNARYKNPDNDKRGVWKSGDFSVKTYSKNYDYPITLPSGRIVNPPKSRCWRTSKENFQKLVNDNRIWFGENGDATPSMKRFLSEVKNGTPPQTIWDYSEVSHNQDARKEIVELFKGEDADFSTPKPEKLLQRIIQIGSNENDIVLDYHLGSGTTCAVAHKMGRQYIGIEQMGYVETIACERMKKVIDGEQGGISKSVNWQGGGSFIYCELAKANQEYIDKINEAKDTKTLLRIWKTMQDKSFISYKVNIKAINESITEFEKLPLEDQKRFLIETLDKNMLYVPYSEIDDTDYNISDEDKKLNHKFYGGK